MVDSEVNLTAASAASEDASGAGPGHGPGAADGPGPGDGADPADGAGPGDVEELPDSVLVRLHELLPEFTGALRRVADQVLADPAAAARATIVELAERSGTSPATVTRFCRALGFDGYADLRLGIASETGRAARQAGWSVDIGREIQPDDSLERVLHQIMAADARALGDTSSLLDLGAGAPAADAIAASTPVRNYRIHRGAPVCGGGPP